MLFIISTPTIALHQKSTGIANIKILFKITLTSLNLFFIRHLTFFILSAYSKYELNKKLRMMKSYEVFSL